MDEYNPFGTNKNEYDKWYKSIPTFKNQREREKLDETKRENTRMIQI